MGSCVWRLVLYFSLGGSSAEVPERIVLTRG